MIRSFKNEGSRDIAAGVNSKAARKLLAVELFRSTQVRMAVLNRAKTLEDLANTPGYKLEKLKGDREGQYSIRINSKYRICFLWKNGFVDEVEVVDYH